MGHQDRVQVGRGEACHDYGEPSTGHTALCINHTLDKPGTRNRQNGGRKELDRRKHRDVQAVPDQKSVCPQNSQCRIGQAECKPDPLFVLACHAEKGTR